MSHFHRNYAIRNFKRTKYQYKKTRKVSTSFGVLLLGLVWGLIAVEIIIQAGN